MKTFLLRFLGASHAHLGLLIIRVALVYVMVMAGWMKLSNPEIRLMTGQAMGTFGITFAPAFWGWCAALAEFGGAILLAIGLFTRIAAANLAFTMFVATASTLAMPEPPLHPMNLMFIYIALFISGPGKYSLDETIFGPKLREAMVEAPTSREPQRYEFGGK